MTIIIPKKFRSEDEAKKAIILTGSEEITFSGKA